MIIGDVVREEATKAGKTVLDDDIEFIVWEFTGYPCFWPDSTKTPEENFRAQLSEYFNAPLLPRRGLSLDEPVPVADGTGTEG